MAKQYDEEMGNALVKKAYEEGIAGFGVGAVIMKGKEILLLRRKKTDTMPGMYEIPSGGVEKDEALDAAIIREVKEETNLTGKVESFFSSFDFTSRRGQAREFNFIVSVENEGAEEIMLTEHDDYVWVSKEEIKKYPMTKEMNALVELVFNASLE